MNAIYHCFWVDANPEKVRSALTTAAGLAGWWTIDVEGSGTQGSVWSFRFASGAFNRMKIVQLEPNRVEWECVDGHAEWVGTRVVFALRPEDGKTKVCFTHSGWRAITEYVGECSFHWAYYMASLQKYCESGRGMPNGQRTDVPDALS